MDGRIERGNEREKEGGGGAGAAGGRTPRSLPGCALAYTYPRVCMSFIVSFNRVTGFLRGDPRPEGEDEGGGGAGEGGGGGSRRGGIPTHAVYWGAF